MTRRAAAWAAVVVPALLLLLFIHAYSLNGAEWDHLTAGELFYRADTGQLTLSYLFSQHNEHRIAVPRLVTLTLGRVTRFNNAVEMYVHWLLLCATVAILFAAFRRDVRLARIESLLLFAPVAALTLSTRPYEILTGDGLLTYLSLFFLVAALYLLAVARRTLPMLAAAILCALLTTFSQSNGMLVWPIGLLVLLCEARSAERARSAWTRAAIWAVVGAIAAAFYLHGYQDPGNHPSPMVMLAHPRIAVEFVLCAFGASLTTDRYTAIAMGALVILAGIACAAVAAREWWLERRQPAFGVWLAVVGAATALMLTANRGGWGVDQALIPRYSQYLSLAPIGLYWCAVSWRDRVEYARAFAVSLGAFLIVGYLAGSLSGWAAGPSWYSARSWRTYVLYSYKYQPPSILKELYPNPYHARMYAQYLDERRLNVFAEQHLDPATLDRGGPAPQFAVERVNGSAPEPSGVVHVNVDDAVVVKGWAFNQRGSGPAADVFLLIDRAEYLPAARNQYRPELGRGVSSRARRWSGFAASFGGLVVPAGEHELRLAIVLDDRRHVYLSEPIVRIARDGVRAY
jgi:hypothetical protein